MVRDDAVASDLTSETLLRTLRVAPRLQPANQHIAFGQFARDDRQLLILVNVGTDRYEGTIHVGPREHWQVLDPATGGIEAASSAAAGKLLLDLNGWQTKILVAPR